MYLPISILAYFLAGVSLIIDKSLIGGAVKNPFVLTFYLGLINLVVLAFIPFGFYFPDREISVLAASSGFIFGIGVLTYFFSLKYFDLLVAIPVIGMVNPVTSLFVGYFLLGHSLGWQHVEGVLLLLLGGGILTANLWFGHHLFNRRLLLLLVSGAFFGLSYSVLNQSFEMTSFVNTLVISRLSLVALGASFLFFPSARREIFASKVAKNHFENRTSLLLVFGQVFGAISGFLLIVGVSLASPALVNSMFSVQFVLLFVLAMALAKKYPKLLHEDLSRKVILLKVTGLLVIALGLLRLFS